MRTIQVANTFIDRIAVDVDKTGTREIGEGALVRTETYSYTVTEYRDEPRTEYVTVTVADPPTPEQFDEALAIACQRDPTVDEETHALALIEKIEQGRFTSHTPPSIAASDYDVFLPMIASTATPCLTPDVTVGCPPPEPVFETVDGSFVPLELEVRNEGGIQYRPIEMVVDRTTYDNIIALGVTPEEFMQAHVDEMNTILEASGVNMRVEVGEIRYVESMTSDQRGPWNVSNSGRWPLTSYDPTGSSGWTPDTLIDTGLLHEWGHSVLGLWDDYGFDVHAASADDPFSPGSTKIYAGPASLMGVPRDPVIAPWAVAQLNDIAAAGTGYQPHVAVGVTEADIPDRATLIFNPSLAGRAVTVHFRDPAGGFDEDAYLTGVISPDGRFVVDPSSLFENILDADSTSSQSHLSRTEWGTMLIAVEGASGPEYFYLDMTNFVEAQLDQGNEASIVID